MFAFAIWDRTKNFFIARDRLGVKPLLRPRWTGKFVFGSEIKTILEAGGVEKEINYNALPDQFANHGTSKDETLFVGVKRLLPWSYVELERWARNPKKYWDINFERNTNRKSDAEYIEEWRDLFKHSVKLRLMADVPLGNVFCLMELILRRLRRWYPRWLTSR